MLDVDGARYCGLPNEVKHLDLFSGIGGFSLGLESTGHFETVAFCEIEEFPRRMLAKHWPDVPCYEDVRDVGAERLAADGIGRIDIVTGGFPCQDLSLAGNRAGLSGERSGLWSELLRVISEVRPSWAIVENVPGLRTLGADRVLSDLAGAGYAAWPMVVGAVHAGAPHRRQRVWIVAHRKGKRRAPKGQRWQQKKSGARPDGEKWHAPHAKRYNLRQEQGRAEPERTGAAEPGDDGEGWDAAWSWDRAPKPVLRGVDDGLPCGMDRRERLKALGNAVVPQIVVAIGRAIVATEVKS